MRLMIPLVLAALASTTLLPAQSINIDPGNPASTRRPDDDRGAGLPERWNKFDALDPSVHFPLYGRNGELSPALADQIRVYAPAPRWLSF